MLLNCCVGEDSRVPWTARRFKPVNPKGNRPLIVTVRTDTEAPILWPPNVKSQLNWKGPRCWERLRAGGEGLKG